MGPAVAREGSIDRGTTNDTTAVGRGNETVTPEMVTDRRSAGEDRGHDQEIVITSANIRTDVARDRAPESTGGIDPGATSVDGKTIATEGPETTKPAGRGAQDETRGVATAAGAEADHHISTRNHAEEAMTEIESLQQICRLIYVDGLIG